ncbi:DMT family transporter [Lacicoccus alkaliphilus]|uniref:Threonine/homoserine efflux transporter RhtA n=1 Tax=Lacicoccus alkaliphilus DSM 16010 TaxID=1123231 RepID=A0A1M7HJ84_9BACL|nr:DMT family transporter [Salinicoccus alkaliphilus]SHM28509.1 Threonine/homoserine efflux transporter RhtA [Salinicoccus alkaliphilus DSM 16010]
MKYTGIALVMLAAMFWGLSGGIADILMERGWDPLVISFYRGAAGFIFVFLWFLINFRENWVKSPRFHLWAVLGGIGVAGNFTFYFLSIQESSVAVAATLMYTAPIFVLLASFILRIEYSTWFKWGCVLSVIIGIILLTGAYDPDSVSTGIAGVVSGLAAGMSYALFIFSFKNASAMGKPQTVLTVAFFSFCLILAALMDIGEAISVLTSDDVWLFILLGIVGAGVSFIIYVIGVRRTTPTTASMVAMVEPVTASLFGVLLLGDQLAIIQIGGMALILITITVLSVKQAA